MNNPFEQLEDNFHIIINKLNFLESKITSDKRWLNISETAYYLGYSKDHIHKMKNDIFIINKHYYKKSGRLLFDKVALDNWVTQSANQLDAKDIAQKVLQGLI
ncbi:MAG: DNA-binding protein [Epsilonproteobacteria bacterium]|nr:MAG: DNA-binding protein [Campylobacterota bacterium]